MKMKHVLLLGIMSALALAACEMVSSPLAPDTASMETDLESENLYESVDGDILRLLECARDNQKLVLVAHRGGFAPGFPENAIETIERTVARTNAIIEIDVVSSADGVDWLHHDTTLDRTTTGTGPIADKGWNVILDLRLRDNSGQPTASQPVAFDEVLGQFAGRTFLMLDLKSPADTAAIVRQVADANMLGSTVFIAYNTDQAREVLRGSPDAILALGQNSISQIDSLKRTGLADRPIIALGDNITEPARFLEPLGSTDYFLLGKSYLGSRPADAVLPTNGRVAAFDQAAALGYQIVATNNAVGAYAYLSDAGVHVGPGDCR